MLKSITLFFAVFILCSCSSKTGLTDISAGPAERQGMLSARIEKYNKAVYWSSSGELSEYLDPSYMADFFKRISKRSEDEELVESKVKNIDFHADSSKATAYIETRFYSKATLYVTSRYEKLDWEFFRLNGGWRLKNIDELSAEHFSSLISE